MKHPRPKAKSASNRALRSVIDEIMSKTEPGERVIVPVQRLLEVAYRRMADQLVQREDGVKRGARAATESREKGRAQVRQEWDRIDADLQGRARSDRARVIMTRTRSDMEPGAKWPTERVIYDYLTIKDARRKVRR